MRNTTLTAFALTALACAAGVQAAPPKPAALVGTSWKIIQIDGKAPASPKAAMQFQAERISATAGCNGLGGTWRIRQGKLVGGPFVSTMMYCQSINGDDNLMAQERALSALLSATPSIDLTRGKLTLRSLGHSAELVRADGLTQLRIR